LKRRRIEMRPLLLVLLTGCGGAIADEGATAAPLGDLPETDGSWGTWQLFSLEQADGTRSYTPPYVELDLHPDGRAYAWTCLDGAPNGLRCPPYLRVACHEGTVGPGQGRWTVRFAGAGGAVRGEGTIVEEPSGDIAIDGTGMLHAGGHYRRVAAASRDGCTP